MYEANALNQYTAIAENGAAAFAPQFDADGNQTVIKTETGIWTAVYNAENRPVSFTNEATGTVVTCAYDSMGRRSFKQVTTNGTVTLHQRYLYRSYLQIACLDLTRSHHPWLWLITWDPTQPIATRPLAIQKDGTWYTYGLDLTKNVCEVFGASGYIATAYTPYGSVTVTGSALQPIQWSSEVWDIETALNYYNWRYYNSIYGIWISRNLINNEDDKNLTLFISNQPITAIDILGLRKLNKEEQQIVNYMRKIAKENKCFQKELEEVIKTYESYIKQDKEKESNHLVVHQALRRFVLPNENEQKAYIEYRIRAQKNNNSTKYQCSRFVKAVIQSALNIKIQQNGITASSFIHTMPNEFDDISFKHTEDKIRIGYGYIVSGSDTKKIGTNEAHIVVSLGHGLSIGHHPRPEKNQEIARTIEYVTAEGRRSTARYDITIRRHQE